MWTEVHIWWRNSYQNRGAVTVSEGQRSRSRGGLLSAAVRQLDHGHVDRAIPLQRRQTQVGNHCLRQAKSAITTNGMPKSVIIANPVPVDVSWWLVAHQIVCE